MSIQYIQRGAYHVPYLFLRSHFEVEQNHLFILNHMTPLCVFLFFHLPDPWLYHSQRFREFSAVSLFRNYYFFFYYGRSGQPGCKKELWE